MNRQSHLIPRRLRNHAEQIFTITDPLCAEHLDDEYADLCRRLIAKLARKRPSPLERGDFRIWAGAAIYTIGSINFLFDRTQKPHLSGDDLSVLTGVPKSTLANKAKMIRGLLQLRSMDSEFCRRELLERNPLPWLVEIGGIVLDARMMPEVFQAEARRRGLIPDLPPRPDVSEGGIP